ncbi:PulJ/GspJ family protein [Formosimonas limnophila]|nr:prepilin-type N-terminal cleavage/methylation domain-containing protein [Formosimonas limnophila]
MMRRRDCHRINSQAGFTLLELLISMVLVLAIIIGVQRFMSGVVFDQTIIGERQEVASETRLVLSNVSRDIARANFYPHASFSDDLPNAVLPPAVGGGQNLFGVRYVAPVGTPDCNGDTTDNQALAGHVGWTLIENRYVLTRTDGVFSLSCDGSGGDSGQVRLIDNVAKYLPSGVVGVTVDAILYNAEPVDLVANPQFIPTNTKLVRLCLLTRVAQNVGDDSAATTDCAGAALPVVSAWVYYKTQVDVAVGSHGFLAGDAP